VDQFDLARYLKQFDETGADWLIFTLDRGRDTSPAGTALLTIWQAASHLTVT
jgi:hypothetical protein